MTNDERRMRILYLSQYFPPEVGATQTRAYEMARGLVRAGHHVTMIAEIPNHPSGIVPPEYRGKWFERTTLDGIDVIRVWVKASPVKTFRTRMAFYLSYMVSAILAGLFLARGRYDVLYATSPPLFVGAAGLVISYLRRIPLVFEVRDLWPESAVVLGELKNPAAISWAERLERACYHRARRIVVVTQGIFDRLSARGYAPDKLAVILNGANTDLFRYRPPGRQTVRQKLGLQGKFIVIYAGIHGLAQGLESVLEAIALMQTYPDIHFLFVGEGPVKQNLMQLAGQRKLSNLTFHPEVPRDKIPDFLSAADVALVPLRRSDLFRGALPSKIFDAWACRCPTLVTIDGEARRILSEAQAGIFVEPENPQALVEAILHLKDNPDTCRIMGENGRRAVEKSFSRQAQARQLVDLLTTVAQSSS